MTIASHISSWSYYKQLTNSHQIIFRLLLTWKVLNIQIDRNYWTSNGVCVCVCAYMNAGICIFFQYNTFILINVLFFARHSRNICNITKDARFKEESWYFWYDDLLIMNNNLTTVSTGWRRYDMWSLYTPSHNSPLSLQVEAKRRIFWINISVNMPLCVCVIYL